MSRYGALNGVEDTIAKLGALGGELRRELRGVVRETTLRAAARARSLAPVGQRGGGGTQQAISTTFFDEGDTGAVFVGPTRDPQTGRSRADNLPIWLEYGTVRMRPHPFLVAAGNAEAPDFERACVAAVTQAVERAE